MEISQIGSTADLIRFYCENDANRNGRLEEGEVEGFSQYDTNGNGLLLPWEVMQAVDLQRSAQIFAQTEIDRQRETRRADSGFYLETTLEQDADVLEIGFKQGEQLRLYSNGGSAVLSGTLAERTRIGDVRFSAGTDISMNVNGTLSGAILLTGSAVVGHTRFGEGTQLSFDENGSLRTARLRNETRIGEARYDENSEVSFYPNGHVREGQLDEEEDPLIDGVRYNGGTYILFYENGQVRMGYPAGDVRAYGHRFTALTDDGVQFHENGALQFGGLIEDAKIQDIELAQDTLLSFDPDGHIDVIYSAPGDVVTVHGTKYSVAGSHCVGFHPNGQVRIGTLAEDATFGDQVVSAGERVCFDEAGHLIQCPAD